MSQETRTLGLITGIILLLSSPVQADVFIDTNATGGDCAANGTWDPSNLTCTLSSDVFDAIPRGNAGHWAHAPPGGLLSRSDEVHRSSGFRQFSLNSDYKLPAPELFKSRLPIQSLFRSEVIMLDHHNRVRVLCF